MSDKESGEPPEKRSRWEEGSSTPAQSRWGTATPLQHGAETPRVATGDQPSSWRGMATPNATPYAVNTPQFGGGQTPNVAMSTPGPGGVTPLYRGFGGTTPMVGATPQVGQTPNYQFEGSTPIQSTFAESQSSLTTLISNLAHKLEKEWRQKNRRLTEEYLDSILPSEDFEVVPVPLEYQPAPPEPPNFYEEATLTLSTQDLTEEELTQQATYDIPEDLGEGMPQMKPKDAEAFVELLRFHNVDPIPDEYLPSYILTKQLFKIKNGTNIQRRAGTRYLLDKSNVFGVRFITEKMFRIWSKNVLDPQEVHYFVEFIKLLIVHVGQGIRDSVKEIIHMVQPLLSTKESLIVREDGKQVLTLMARVVGFDVIFAAVKEDCSAGESVIRRHAALVIAICGYASGGEEMMRTLTEISNIPHPHVQQTVCVALAEMAPLFGHATISFLPEIVPVLARLLQEDRKVRVDSARAVSAIAEACAPYGIEELEPLVSIICDECKRGLGTNARYFLQAFGSLVSLMSPHDAQRYTQDMMNVLVSQFNRPEDEFRRVMLMVVRRCIASDGVTADFIRDVMLDSYFEGFWGVQRLATNRRTAAALVITTVEIAKKVGGDEVLSRLTPMMKHENEEYQRMVVNTVRAVVDNEGLDNSPHGLLVSLLDGGMTALRQDTMGTSSAVKDCLASICIALGKRLNKFLPQVLDLINSRRESKEPGQRSQAVNLVTRIAPTIMEADGAIFLSELGRSIYERMEDDDPHVMAACIRASEAILAELGGAKYRPSVKELLKRLTHVISNQHNIVQQNCISLIELVVTRHDQEVDPIDLHKLATEGLFKLLDADRRKTRQTCARVFGKVAESIRPFAIILELVDNFRQDKRKVRVCTAIALASIAKACGPFTVLPYLLNEYKLSEGEQVAVIIQHSVLKAIRYIFEFIGAVGKEYVYPLLPLLERALTENSIQMRRMATEASIAIVLALSGNDGFEEVAIHLLNFIHPNIVELLSRKEARVGEERLKMVTAVVGYYEAIRTVLHPGQIMQYLYQGLFHPATKVRDIYRRTYNMIYMVSPQSLLPYYPRIKDTPQHVLTHHELEVLV